MVLAQVLALTLVSGVLALLGPGAPSASAALPSLRLTAAGDYAATADTSAVLDTMASLQPQANLALGDFSYGVTGEEQQWCDFVTSHVGSLPFELLSGNHESNGKNGNLAAFAACLPNRMSGLSGSYGKEYWVDVPAENPVARIVMISPGTDFGSGPWNYNKGTAHYNWTAAAIDGARAKGVPWVIVGMHKPCLTMGRYTCEPGADITNLLVSKKVDLVLQGHEHIYQRSKQLRNGVTGCSTIIPGRYQGACVADADSSLSKGAGTVFATVGTGGTALRDVYPGDAEARYFVKSSGANSNPTHGLVDLQFAGNALKVTFHRASGGSFGDAFTISRTRYAGDTFSRTVAAGWGSTSPGATWAVTDGSKFSVNGAQGLISSARGKTLMAKQPVSARDTDTRFVAGLDTMPGGSGYYLRVHQRLGSGGFYNTKLRFSPNGAVAASVARVSSSGAGATLKGYTTVSGLTYRAGMKINVRSRVTGAKPTTIKVKVWPVGKPEPAAWTVSVTDSTSALQGNGAWRLESYLSSSTSQSSVRVRVDDLVIDRP